MPRAEQSYKEHISSIDRNGNYTGAEIQYTVFEAQNEDAALNAVLEAAPTSIHDVALDSIEIETRENDTTFKVRAVYKKSNGASTTVSGASDARVSFDCSGGTRHLTMADYTEMRYPNWAGMLFDGIGWNGKTGSELELSGVDIPSPQLRETYVKTMSLSSITTVYRRNIAGLVGKVNSKKFKGWDSGEVMFLGISYSSSSVDKSVDVTFNFAIQLNESHCEYCGKDIGQKKGWQYAWAIPQISDNKSGVPDVSAKEI